MEKRKSFIFYAEWTEALADYPGDVRLEVYEAAIRYAAYGEETELRPLANMAFRFIKGDIDRDNAKYEEFLERQRTKGVKGGAPAGNQNARSKNNPNNPRVEKTTQTTHGLKNNPNNPRVEKQPKDVDVDDKYITESSLRSDSAVSQSTCDAEAGIDCKAFIDYFNSEMAEAGAAIPHRVSLTERRAAAIKARAKEYGTDGLRLMVQKAKSSHFLNGGGDKAFVATLDWLLRPNNFPKVIEGNYDNINGNGTDGLYSESASARRTAAAADNIADFILS